MQRLIHSLSDLAEKKIAIVGVGKSGISLGRLLSSLGAKLILNDTKPEEDILRDASSFSDNIIKVFSGGHPPEAFEEAEMVVVSPGVPLSTPSLVSALYKGLPVVGEIELSWEILNIINPEIKIIGITGSNGKSTTSTLTYEFLKKDGKAVALAGNIGLPMADVVYQILTNEIAPQYLVLELSSFQLEGIRNFKANSAAILNITPDHMDRYSGMKEYIDAKARIFQNQSGEDFLVLNMDDKNTLHAIEKLRDVYLKRGKIPHILYFSRFQRVYGAFVDGGAVRFNAREDIDEAVREEMEKAKLIIDSFRIKGVHNIENIMAASLLAFSAGCRAQSIQEVVEEFPGLPHRMEFVREINGVAYINDSKGTNVDAVSKSLESFAKNVILIAGGKDKEGDFNALREIVKQKVKALILIGEASQKIANSLGDLVPHYFEKDMKAAIYKAKEIAERGDVVLLSPGCASFDMFRNFEHRGDVFKEIVKSL
ncbi:MULTISPECIES: UDP-N-acetylmuramoyl-L-alanine--D-glutamate ligase [Thermodesulfovibrio]|jgi:UDP-N-acetylmuramoylalanine--D-glutamate ligase|uniref:UDP-N-acetylmuramoyl-L-alanine--D-glutamate ligase n=1 Tax=Thermodesulfovibrio TaxID=28261 RepID=UPI002602252F|nr:UDP-N-acetylmuramoyl-L-alanine--D-glutamate ligase [Thermodesulfovibrio sp.]